LNRSSDRPFIRLALIGAAVMALGLSGCGRKGPLDPPPGASLTNEPPPAVAPVGAADPLVAPTTEREDVRAGRPQAPAGPNKRIFLDNLLN
jgi:predicted small lipoprotein YifL